MRYVVLATGMKNDGKVLDRAVVKSYNQLQNHFKRYPRNPEIQVIPLTNDGRRRLTEEVVTLQWPIDPKDYGLIELALFFSNPNGLMSSHPRRVLNV